MLSKIGIGALMGATVLCVGASAWAAEGPAANMQAMHQGDAAKDAKAPPTDEELIASASKAAPKYVADHATIVAPGEKGAMRTLRKGTNAFTCMPDNPE